jgi:hypothetical protein
MVSLRLQTNWTSYTDDVVSRARALRFLGGFACGARVRFGCLRRVDFLGLRALVWRVLCFFLLFLCGSWRESSTSGPPPVPWVVGLLSAVVAEAQSSLTDA